MALAPSQTFASLEELWWARKTPRGVEVRRVRFIASHCSPLGPTARVEAICPTVHPRQWQCPFDELDRDLDALHRRLCGILPFTN